MNGLSALSHGLEYSVIASLWQYSLLMLAAILMLAPIMYSLLTTAVRIFETKIKNNQAQ